MNKVVLLSCVRTQKQGRHQAKDLYISSYFKKSFAYAKKLGYPIRILSTAKYVVKPEDIIDSYDVSKKVLQGDEWSTKVMEKLCSEFDINNTLFIIFAGKEFVSPLKKELPNLSAPLEGMGIGEILSYFNKKLKEIGGVL